MPEFVALLKRRCIQRRPASVGTMYTHESSQPSPRGTLETSQHVVVDLGNGYLPVLCNTIQMKQVGSTSCVDVEFHSLLYV